MNSVRRTPPSEDKDDKEQPRLPHRWAIILLTTTIIAAVVGALAGPVAAVTVGATVLAVMHQVLA